MRKAEPESKMKTKNSFLQTDLNQNNEIAIARDIRISKKLKMNRTQMNIFFFCFVPLPSSTERKKLSLFAYRSMDQRHSWLTATGAMVWQWRYAVTLWFFRLILSNALFSVLIPMAFPNVLFSQNFKNEILLADWIQIFETCNQIKNSNGILNFNVEHHWSCGKLWIYFYETLTLKSLRIRFKVKWHSMWSK